MSSESCNMLSTATSSDQGEIVIMGDSNADFKTCVLFVYQSAEIRKFSCELTQNCLFFEKSNLPAKECQESYIRAIGKDFGKQSMSCGQEFLSHAAMSVNVCGADINYSSVKSSKSSCDNLECKSALLYDQCHLSSVWDVHNSGQARAVFQKILLLSMESDVAGSVTQEMIRSPAFVDGFIQFVTSKGMLCRKLSCSVCGSSFIAKSSLSSRCCLVIFMKFPCRVPINYSWCHKIGDLVIKLMMLDDAMNWLSTLGGAYSALGDYFNNHAVNAGVISLRQLRIALEMGSPPIVIRCYLYLSLSLMQTGRLHEARILIREKYEEAKRLPVEDIHLIRMCGGLWCRLKYLRTLRRLHKSEMTSVPS